MTQFGVAVKRRPSQLALSRAWARLVQAPQGVDTNIVADNSETDG